MCGGGGLGERVRTWTMKRLIGLLVLYTMGFAPSSTPACGAARPGLAGVALEAVDATVDTTVDTAVDTSETAVVAMLLSGVVVNEAPARQRRTEAAGGCTAEQRTR